GRHRGIEDFHPFLEGLRVERQRTTVVTTLVRRRFSRRAKAAPFAGTKPRSLRGAKIESGFDGRGARQLALIEPITFKSDARRGPFCFRHPAAGALLMKRPRRDALLH